MNLTAEYPSSRFAAHKAGEKTRLPLKPYSQGMGALGLPGDASSASRFVRAAFLRWNSVSEKTETSNVTQFFHILDGVAMVRGSVVTPEGTFDMTTYSCCVNARTGRYYYKTYDDMRIGLWICMDLIWKAESWWRRKKTPRPGNTEEDYRKKKTCWR